MGKEIKNSIEDISKKKTGFSIPPNYLHNLEDTIAAKLLEENFPTETGFEVSDTYFNNLEEIILAKVSSDKNEIKVISFKVKVLKMIPIIAAASIILFIGLNSFVFKTTEAITIDSLSDDDLAIWLDYNTFTTNDIALVLEDDILEENDFYFSTIKDITIEDYINNSSYYIDLLNEID